MPGGDGTGPFGEGRMTGRGMGYCRGNTPRFINQGFRRGYGRGFAWATDDEDRRRLEEELELLKQRITQIEDKLKVKE